MDIKSQLTLQLVEAAQRYPDSDDFRRHVKVLLGGYRLEKIGQQPSDLPTQIQRFLGAKRIEGLSAKTLDNYKIYLNKFSGVVRKDADLVTADDIRGYIGGLQVKESSIQTILASLRSFFSWLTREEIIIKNPMNKIPSQKRAGRQLPRALSVESLERLRASCRNTRESALLEFLYSTGCRVSELCGIKLQQVDFTSRCVRVTGKGGHERQVYFSVRAGLLLRRYIQERKGGDMLFVNTRAPFGAMSPRSVEKVIHAMGLSAEIHENVWPHRLRHTMATLAHNNGMQITVLQAILGHKQLSTTQIYATISPENVRYEHERFIA